MPHIVEFQPDVLVWGDGAVLVREFYAYGISVSDKIAQKKPFVAVLLGYVGIDETGVNDVACTDVVR